MLADVSRYAGLVCIDARIGMDLELQLLLFGFVLEELSLRPDLTNQILEVTVDESGVSGDIFRYEFPAQN